jgi:hypothetical protein
MLTFVVPTNGPRVTNLMQCVHHSIENRFAPEEVRKFSDQVRQEPIKGLTQS